MAISSVGIPTQTTSINGNQNTQQTSTGSASQTGQQANTYNAGQQGLQNVLGGYYQQLLSGNIPTSFTAPQQVLNSYQQQFQNQVAPGLAAQYGAGSPQIAAQNTQGLTSLLSNLYQQGVGNYNNALAGASSYGLTPIGQTTAQQGTTASSTNQNTQFNQNQTINQSLLNWLLQSIGTTLGGGLSNPGGG